jgi:hypothetical protein
VKRNAREPFDNVDDETHTIGSKAYPKDKNLDASQHEALGKTTLEHQALRMTDPRIKNFHGKQHPHTRSRELRL